VRLLGRQEGKGPLLGRREGGELGKVVLVVERPISRVEDP
jgi:hypothetical protein